VAVDDADHRDHDRRQQHAEAPEDERVDEARYEACEQLALAEHDRHLVARANGGVAAALERCGGAQQAGEEDGAAGEQRAAEEDCGGEQDRRERGGAYGCLAFRIASAIAGRTSWRSPTTA
jgi:hypothetical protein